MRHSVGLSQISHHRSLTAIEAEMAIMMMMMIVMMVMVTMMK